MFIYKSIYFYFLFELNLIRCIPDIYIEKEILIILQKELKSW